MSTDQPAGTPPEQDTVLQELTALGKKLGATVQAALTSPQAKELESEVREGFQTVVSEVNEALNKARSTDVAKEVGQQTEKVVDTVRSSKVTQDLKGGLIKGLRTLNRELDELVHKMEGKPAEAPSAPEVVVEASAEPVTESGPSDAA